MRWPLITAHTGCLNTPPNSIPSVLAGLKAGADLIEVDVRATKDGIVILLHDEHVFTTAYGSRRVRDLTFEELKSLAVNEEITLLEDVLPLIREANRIINLDVKEDSAVGPMIETVEKYNMRDYAIISGCEKERAAYVKENHRLYQVVLNASARLFETCGADYDTFVRETCGHAISASCSGVNINYRFCREQLLDYAGRRCLPVLVWTVDETHVMDKYLDMGVHSITSNEVLTLMQLRENRRAGR
ncbi:glycerophosphodiester phosphodiesterase [Paenibacillus wynnii]|uniref:glycerophosphodiester phosphodiesterase n=1 Tax=Paenibacillus wynnii TaxID=268407 RepID=UPI00278EB922|nr:glycerophosphodiester phosphodiesterase family protein [Paenibacillus wynnii]MDQ0193613.1 glycerophosphoryl diester phosphodiesterase [Paenibacillus wynnii]